MSDTKELTYSDVSEHTSKKDLYMVIHNKVYNASSFVDEHPYVNSLSLSAHLTDKPPTAALSLPTLLPGRAMKIPFGFLQTAVRAGGDGCVFGH